MLKSIWNASHSVPLAVLSSTSLFSDLHFRYSTKYNSLLKANSCLGDNMTLVKRSTVHTFQATSLGVFSKSRMHMFNRRLVTTVIVIYPAIATIRGSIGHRVPFWLPLSNTFCYRLCESSPEVSFFSQVVARSSYTSHQPIFHQVIVTIPELWTKCFQHSYDSYVY